MYTPDEIEHVLNEAEHNDNPKEGKFPDISPGACRLSARLVERPPAREMLMTIDGQGVLPVGIVGQVGGTGGTGKTMLSLQMSFAASKGEGFRPFKFPRPLKVLYFSQEDDQSEIDRRLWDIANEETISENLYVAALPGECGPFMQLRDGNPERSEVFHWFDSELENYSHVGLDLVFLDTASRFNGLSENNNEHGAAFMRSLEALAQRHGITILIATHTNENSVTNPPPRMDKTMFRGGSAGIDNARIGFGMRAMTETTAKSFNVQNRHEYVELDTVKSNYAPKLKYPIFYKRGENGVLQYVNPYKKRTMEMATLLVDVLAEDGTEYTLRELKKDKKAKHIFEAMKEVYPKYRRLIDTESAIDYALNQGWLTNETTTTKRGKPKGAIKVVT